MKTPFFTIITVCYNAGDGLQASVEELKKQSFGDYEHIIKDGGSTDGSIESVSSLLESDSRIRLTSCPDSGIYDAMNQALEQAQGRYVYFLNCGDRFADTDVLSDLYNKTVSGQDNAVYYGDFLLRGERIRQPERVDKFYLYRRPLNHQSVFFGREVFEHHGNFDTVFSIRADHELTLRAFVGGSEFHRIDRDICVYEGGGFSEREDKKEIRASELEAIRLRYFSPDERKKYDLRIKLSMTGLRSYMRSERAPKWLRAIYRKAANFFNK